MRQHALLSRTAEWQSIIVTVPPLAWAVIARARTPPYRCTVVWLLMNHHLASTGSSAKDKITQMRWAGGATARAHPRHRLRPPRLPVSRGLDPGRPPPSDRLPFLHPAACPCSHKHKSSPSVGCFTAASLNTEPTAGSRRCMQGSSVGGDSSDQQHQSAGNSYHLSMVAQHSQLAPENGGPVIRPVTVAPALWLVLGCAC
jgi:hypothetical protein